MAGQPAVFSAGGVAADGIGVQADLLQHFDDSPAPLAGADLRPQRGHALLHDLGHPRPRVQRGERILKDRPPARAGDSSRLYRRVHFRSIREILWADS
jgi:hypothetical protein